MEQSGYGELSGASLKAPRNDPISLDQSLFKGTLYEAVEASYEENVVAATACVAWNGFVAELLRVNLGVEARLKQR